MYHQRMMKRGFTFPQLDRHRFEFSFLLRSECIPDHVHVVCKVLAWQEVPAMATRNVMNAAVFARGIVQTDPTRQMGHRLSSGPIRVVLMPDNHGSMPGRLVKDLVVPEPHCTLQQLICRHSEGGMP